MNSGIWPWRKLKSLELHDGVMRNFRMKTAPLSRDGVDFGSRAAVY